MAKINQINHTHKMATFVGQGCVIFLHVNISIFINVNNGGIIKIIHSITYAVSLSHVSPSLHVTTLCPVLFVPLVNLEVIDKIDSLLATTQNNVNIPKKNAIIIFNNDNALDGFLNQR